MLTTKRCSKCGTTKDVSMFGKHEQKPDGLRSWCKECNSSDARRWSKENPERKKSASIAWKLGNPEAFKRIAKRSQIKNAESRLPKQRSYSKRCADSLTDNYVMTTLGVDRYLVTAELIELKRINLQLQRLLKERQCIVDGETGKRCSVCHFEKKLTAFSVRSRAKDGKSYRCKECDKIKQRAHYEKNAGNIKESVRVQQIKSTAKVDNYYVGRLLKKDLPAGAHVPKSLVETKKIQIQIHRHLKENK